MLPDRPPRTGPTPDGIDATAVPTARPVRFELTWDARSDGQPVDLDIGCFYWATDGTRGAVQSFGAAERPDPVATNRAGRELIGLSSDRTVGGGEGERLTLHHPASITFLVVHTSIYQGAADFRDLGAHIAVRSGSRLLIDVSLASPAPGLGWCAALVLGAADSGVHLVREERYFRSAFHADRHYGLGLEWVVGHKPDDPGGLDRPIGGGDGAALSE